MKPSQLQQIESYLSGQMTAHEKEAFEADLQANPELKQELDFQSDVIQGIGEYRKAQLKARLDAIDVSPAWWNLASQSSSVQAIVGALVIASVGLGIYFYDSDDAKEISNESSQEIVINAPQQEDPLVWQVPELPKKGSDDVKNKNIDQYPGDQQVFEKNDLSKTREQKAQNKSTADFNPDVVVPDAGGGTADAEFTPEALEAPEDDKTREKKPIDVEVVDKRAKKIQYKYYSGKLYLLGDFGEEPYEILEVNSSEGRKIYLYHADEYYKISVSDKMKALQAIENKRLIRELAILRKAD